MQFSHFPRVALTAVASTCALAFLVLAPRPAHAQIILAQGGGAQFTGPERYLGQSFTVNAPGTVTVTDIAFNFFAPLTVVGGFPKPVAFGTGFLFSSEYLGAPSAMSTATPGYLGQATAAGGFYSFGTTVVLTGGTKYYFYEDALIPAGAVTGGSVIFGGDAYSANSSTSNFVRNGGSSNFYVTGRVAPNAVPEPGVWVTAASLAGTTAFGLVRGRRRMRKEAKQSA